MHKYLQHILHCHPFLLTLRLRVFLIPLIGIVSKSHLTNVGRNSTLPVWYNCHSHIILVADINPLIKDRSLLED